MKGNSATSRRVALEAAGYLSLSVLARKHGESRDTLALWAKRCPWLPGGQTVRTKPDPANPRTKLYLERDVVEAIAARDAATIAPVDEYEEDGEKQVWIRKAKKYAKVSWQVVFRWIRKGAYWRNGEKLDHCEKLIYNGRGRPFPRLFVPLRQLREFASEYRKAPKRTAAAGRLAGGEVCRRLGCSPSFLGTLIRKGHPALGRKLRFWGDAPYREYSADDVSIMEPAFNRPKAPFSDGAGCWLPLSFVAKKYKLTEQTLRQMHKHGDAVTGLPVRGNRVLCRTGACCRETLFLHEGDLEAVFDARAQLVQSDSHPSEFSLKEAAGVWGVSPITAGFWVRRGCPWKGGAAIDAALRPARPRSRQKVYFVPAQEVKAVKVAMGLPSPDSFITIPQAAAKLKLKEVTVGMYRWRGCPWLGGDKLDGVRARCPRSGRLKWFVSVRQVETIAKNRRAGIRAPMEPGDQAAGNGQAAKSTAAADAVDQAAGEQAAPVSIGKSPVDPAREPAPAQRSRKRKWAELEAMILEFPGESDQTIANRYNRRYARRIADGTLFKATAKTVRNTRAYMRRRNRNPDSAIPLRAE